ncbi:GNAT family N-acetyltransferase [Cognatiyoonia sp. IB215182]|uniref:GNAT family N-acetyltransferase n=1 Tax=Cognatiyoonia sp. IB215182 TaxID=3097353 RepID=UPI002A15B193|nr:GNAT family N-acetyltransferase [Cognatiyoonia sp. IB215182]MDX8351293.1 GNAT family N-acetyltransferase [Cognatiyoonia sp. IB215182]
MRLARATDADAIWPLLRDVFRAGETYAVDPQISKDAALDYWMTQPRAVYVAEEGGQILGTYYIKTNQPGGGAHICNCGYIVAPAARGQGLAAQMCAHSQAEARALGYKAMQFNFVLASNEGAVRLWHRLGFQTLATIPDAFDHPILGMVAAHIMHKSLVEGS